MDNQRQSDSTTHASAPRTGRTGTLQIDRSHETGNAARESQPFRGWFLGQFVPEQLGLRATDQVEVKWGVHEAGERQAEWSLNRTATTISILLRGRDRISFPDGDVLLEREGDYVIWGPGVPHRWHALAHSVVLTVRWPSARDDAVLVSEDDVVSYLAETAG